MFACFSLRQQSIQAVRLSVGHWLGSLLLDLDSGGGAGAQLAFVVVPFALLLPIPGRPLARVVTLLGWHYEFGERLTGVDAHLQADLLHGTRERGEF